MQSFQQRLTHHAPSCLAGASTGDDEGQEAPFVSQEKALAPEPPEEPAQAPELLQEPIKHATPPPC